MNTCTKGTNVNWRRSALAAIFVSALATAAEALHDAPAFVYDTTAGVTAIYDGDLSAGVWSFEAIVGRSYRARRLWTPPHQGVGFFGDGPAPASFSATVHLVEFIDNTPNGSGSGDVAIFTGEGDGVDLVVVDEQGNRLEANIPSFEYLDDTDNISRPGYVVQGVLSDVVISGPEFQGVCARHLGSFASIYMFTFVVYEGPSDPITVEEYLASSGLGGLALEIENVEILVTGSDCWGDLDGDNDIDQEDLAILLTAYGVDGGGDLDCTGFTDQLDLGILLANYGLTCP